MLTKNIKWIITDSPGEIFWKRQRVQKCQEEQSLALPFSWLVMPIVFTQLYHYFLAK